MSLDSSSAAAEPIPLSPPPTYDSLLPDGPSTDAIAASSDPADGQIPEESVPSSATQEPSQSQLIRLSWSSSDHLPSEDEAMSLDPPRLSLAVPDRHGSSQVTLVDRSSPSPLDAHGTPAPIVRSVAIPSYTTFNAVTLFAITVVLAASQDVVTVHRRYSQFRDLHERLGRVFPRLRITMGRFPAKSGPRRYDERFLDKRRRRLQEWLAIVLHHPDLGASPLVRDWLLSSKGAESSGS